MEITFMSTTKSTEKWSPTPWVAQVAYYRNYPPDNSYWEASIHSEGRFVVTAYGRTREEAEANAARIVECVNFCAGVSSEDMSGQKAVIWRDEIDTLTKQEETTAEIVAQLTAENQALREERDKAVALVESYDRQDDIIGAEFEGVDEVTDVIRLLKQERDVLKIENDTFRESLPTCPEAHELEQLRKECEGLRNILTDAETERDMYKAQSDNLHNDLRAQLAKSEAAVEWVNKYGPSLISQGGLQGCRPIWIDELRAIIGKEKE